MHGWYSGLAAREIGSSLYRRQNGEEVWVTEVDSNPVSVSKWPDLEYRGEVTTWIRNDPILDARLQSEIITPWLPREPRYS